MKLAQGGVPPFDTGKVRFEIASWTNPNIGDTRGKIVYRSGAFG
jgi:hypothetical protein